MVHPSTASAVPWQTAPERDFLAFRLILLAELQLDTWFSDSAEIMVYRRKSRRGAGRGESAGVGRTLAVWEREGAILTLSALPVAETFQVGLRGASFGTILTLRYVPEDAILQGATVEQFTGDLQAALAAAAAWLEDVPDLSEETMLKAAPAGRGGGASALQENEEAPDDRVDPWRAPQADPAPPTPLPSFPAPTPADIREIKALARTVAGELRRHGAPSLDAISNAWLESEPQTLWPLLDVTVAACNARKRDEAVITGCRWLLANQLELIRYRLERGHDWARAMLDTFQEKLIALVQAKTLQESDWFELVKLLRVAKVPIQPEMAEALTMAAVDVTSGEVPSPEDIPRQLRGLLDDLGRSAESPFQVVEGLAETGALMPPELRAYMTHELGLSPHAVLREAVPLLLLDPEPAVRQAAAAVLEQVAAPETVSPVMLRRTLLIRNWVPEDEREAIDRLVRKVRLKGVACAQWTAAPALAIHCSMVDGSGAQSLVMTTPTGRTGVFIGLLLKQGFGIRDAWCNSSLPRSEINRSIRETQRMPTWHTTGRDHLDVVVQHHIARGVQARHLPQATIVEIAEAIGAADWKDRGLDVAADIERLFAGLGAELSRPSAIAASLQRSGVWITNDPMVQTWFEDDAAIRALVEGRPRPKPEMAVRQVLEDVLPARREVWVEKLLLFVLWLRARTGGATTPNRWQDCVVLAHALLAGRKLVELPGMVAIAERSIFAARAGAR